MSKNQQDQTLGAYRSWLISFVGSLFFFFEFFQLSSFDPLNAHLQIQYHLSPSQVSWLGSAYLWANVICLLPAGILMDKFGPRRCMLSSLAIAILGLTLFEYGHCFSLVLLGRFIVGTGNAFCFIGLIVLISQWFPANRQAFAMAIMVNVGFLGGLTAHTPLVWILETFGWSTLMLVNLGMGLVIWVLHYLFVRNGPGFVQALPRSTISLAEYRQKVLTLQNFGAGIYISCLNLPIMVLCALWGIEYLRDVHHLDAYQASNVVSMIFLGSMLGSPLLGWISDHLQSRKKVMWFAGCVTLFLCLPLCFVQQAVGYVLLILMFLLLGFFSSAQVLGYPLITESNANEYVGRATSLASMLIIGGGMLGQIAYGAVLNHGLQLSLAMAYRQAMLLFPLSILLALFFLVWMKETFCKKTMETS